jgi:hypothetical protein
MGAAATKLSKLEGSVSMPVGTSRPVFGQLIMTMAMVRVPYTVWRTNTPERQSVPWVDGNKYRLASHALSELFAWKRSAPAFPAESLLRLIESAAARNVGPPVGTRI